MVCLRDPSGSCRTLGSVARGREVQALWRSLPLLGLWLAAGIGLSALTGRVRDWFDMTDELRYERLAISIARTHSLVPRIHGVDVQSFSQLYPLLIAPIFAHGLVPQDLVHAHVFNAWLMTSACIPAYLLTRRVIEGRRWAYLVAALSVCMPWIVYSTMLMTEVAAYPASLWALLALHRTTVRPSARADLVALLALALAFFARTELLVLVFVPPPAIVAFELGRAGGVRRLERLAAGLRAAVQAHRLLAIVYAVLVTAGIAAHFAGKLSGVVGVYGTYAQQSSLLPAGLAGAFAAHVALFSLGFGVLPFLVGAAWLLAGVVRPGLGREQHAFACIGAVMLAAVLFQGTNFDVRYTGYVHDRFLLYLVPPVLIGMACALDACRRPRWSLFLPALVTVCGFAWGDFPEVTWKDVPTLSQDSPMSGLLRPIVHMTHTLGEARVLLVVATAALAGLFVAGSARVTRARLALVTAVFALVALPAITFATFAHFFGTIGWSGRPVTASEAGLYDWIDPIVGADAGVTIVPYLVSTNYFVSEELWRDIEFWNKAVVRDAVSPGGDVYAYTGIWFPKTSLSFDPETGRANVSPTRYAAVSDKDTRFAIAGKVRGWVQDVQLIEADRPWRAQWVSFGLYDDGWTKPGVTARIRVFPFPGQRQARLRTFVFGVRTLAGSAPRPVRVVSNVDGWAETATDTTVNASIKVCVPPQGYAEIRLSTPVVSTIPGDQSSQVLSVGSRRGGVFFGETAIGSEIGGAC